jgi:hypothetical protein
VLVEGPANFGYMELQKFSSAKDPQGKGGWPR